MRELKPERIRDMTEEEIRTKIRELKEEIFNMAFRNKMRQLQNPLLLRERRRDIARLETILTEHTKGIRPLAGHGPAAEAGAKREAAPKGEGKAKRDSRREAKPKGDAKATKEPKAKGEAKAKKEAKKP